MADLPTWTVAKTNTSGKALVTLDEIKDWLRIVGDDQDTILSTIQDAAHDVLESRFGRATRTGTYVMTFSNVLPARADVELARPPLSSVDKVEKWVEGDDQWETVDSGEYVVAQPDAEPAVVRPANTWPAYRLRFTYTAGYAQDKAPSDLKMALLELCAHHYEHRGDVDATDMPPRFKDKYGGLNIVWL